MYNTYNSQYIKYSYTQNYVVDDITLRVNRGGTAVLLTQHKDLVVINGVEKLKEVRDILQALIVAQEDQNDEKP
jgi:hypothetical protein